MPRGGGSDGATWRREWAITCVNPRTFAASRCLRNAFSALARRSAPDPSARWPARAIMRSSCSNYVMTTRQSHGNHA